MAQAGLLGNAVYHFILIIERFKILIKFVFRLLVMLDEIIAIASGSSQSFLNGLLVGIFS